MTVGQGKYVLLRWKAAILIRCLLSDWWPLLSMYPQCGTFASNSMGPSERSTTNPGTNFSPNFRICKGIHLTLTQQR